MTENPTLDQIETWLDSGKLQIRMANGRWWAVRRNGATKRWKRDQTRFRIPVKAGLKVYDAITDDCDFWTRFRVALTKDCYFWSSFRLAPDA